MVYIVDDVTKDATTITLSLGKIKKNTLLTVSDPCYLDNDYTGPLHFNQPNPQAAMSMGRMAAGEWIAWADIADLGPGGFGGKRVVQAGIHLLDGESDDSTHELQGVDSGMVGFFVGSPFLTYNETWEPYTAPRGRDQKARLLERDGGKAWITDSGLGDGVYDVTILWRGKHIIAVSAVFLEEGDEDE